MREFEASTPKSVEIVRSTHILLLSMNLEIPLKTAVKKPAIRIRIPDLVSIFFFPVSLFRLF
jgi:hypothetical protein